MRVTTTGKPDHNRHMDIGVEVVVFRNYGNVMGRLTPYSTKYVPIEGGLHTVITAKKQVQYGWGVTSTYMLYQIATPFGLLWVKASDLLNTYQFYSPSTR